MYYKIPKSSPTGQQLTALHARMTEANQRAQSLIESFGAIEFRPGFWTVAGGISSIIFPEGKPEKAELKHWKKGAKDGEYLPSQRTPKARQMAALVEALPRVVRLELNAIVGYKHQWNVVGIGWGKDSDHYALDLMEKWDVKAPDDCIEITCSEWKALTTKNESEVENG